MTSRPEPYRIVAPRHEPVAPRESSHPAREATFDVEADVVVVGGGCAGLCSALFASWLGDAVVLAREGAGAGRHDREVGLLVLGAEQRAAARLPGSSTARRTSSTTARGISRPERYRRDQPHLRHRRVGARDVPCDLREHVAGRRAAGRARRAALPPLRRASSTTWATWSRTGRRPAACSSRAGSNEAMTDGGAVGVGASRPRRSRPASTIRTGHRVQRLVLAGAEVVGRRGLHGGRRPHLVRRAQGRRLRHRRLRPRRGAVRALPRRAVGRRCAARTNEGDFVRIAPTAGAQLRNMQYAWRCPIPLEKAAAKDPHMQGTTAFPGDSMICVNYQGQRVPQREAPLQRARLPDVRLGRAALRVPQPRADPALGPALAGALAGETATATSSPRAFHPHVFSARHAGGC